MFKCAYCPKKYKIEKNQQNHSLTCKKKPEICVTCEICGWSVSERNSYNHIQNCKQTHTQCPWCSKYILRELNQNMHHIFSECPEKKSHLRDVHQRIEIIENYLIQMLEKLDENKFEVENLRPCYCNRDNDSFCC